MAWWLGLLHDVGKAAECWQRLLVLLGVGGGRIGVDHKAAGTRLAVTRLGLGRLAMAVHGHHGGLESPASLHGFLTSPDRDLSAEQQAVSRLSAVIPELRDPKVPPWPDWARTDRLAQEMLLRMLFSALVDADFLDTQAHFRGASGVFVSPRLGMAELLRRFEHKRMKRFGARPSSDVGEMRAQVYRDCVAAAGLPPGFFRLAAPTGAGKTIAVGGFALHHAARFEMRRVVVAVPFLSVTDQNAQVYRDFLDSGGTGRVVLEHHTAVNVEGGRGSRWRRLAAENWDAEFIITTTVQLFESLHARTPSRMRKLHRLARSVIVLDEVQAIPVHVLEPVLLVLRQLVDHFGVTVVLSSATQPEFWHLPVVDGVKPRPIISDTARLYATLKRVRYRWWTRPKPTLAEVAAEAATHPKALVVVNTTAHARVIAGEWSGREDAQVRHLSTRMCSRHRLDTIDKIRELLSGDGRVLVVSTQLIEAGVDLDFPAVYRAMAPAESLLQAAGRCNREGCLGHAGGLVVVFDPVETGSPPTYAIPVHETRKHFGPAKGQAELDDLDEFAAYSASVYSSLSPIDRGQAVVDARAEWDCRRVADLFRMIDDNTVPVVVDYTPTDDQKLRKRADRVLSAIRRGLTPRPDELRHLQPFLATIPRGRAQRDSRAVPLIGDLHVWTGHYDSTYGIDLDSEET
ncbi:hypothetical protein ADL03_25430 [Nocardia sp. NRRL S-836]|nr:hypothetical protein ADL03_25430 [Nocardia sp. NRRL S-836]